MGNIDTSHKYLVVDDELVTNPNDLEDTVIHMGVPKNLGLFASNYEEAIDILTSEKDIVICYVDYKIPKNNQHSKANYEDRDEYWGLSLIPQIRALNSKAKIVVYSSYVTKDYLQNTSGEFKKIVTAFFEKPHGMEERRKYYLDAINSSLSFKYEELDAQTRIVLIDKTNKIKGLIKQTAQNMLVTGRYLNEVKQILPHGQFEKWYKTELGISNASVSRMMNAAKRFESYAMEDLDPLGVATLYQLSDPDIPDEALKTIIEDNNLSKSLSYEDAKRLKQQFKTQKKLPKKETEFKSSDAVTLAPIDNSLITQSGATSTTFASKENIIRVIPRQKIWHLGTNHQHTIVAADPNSPDFLSQLPPKISLCLAFPPEKNWQFQFKNRHTTNILDSKYHDLDNLLLLEIVDRLIKISTNEQDNVAICFLPEPKILSVVHQLGCRAYVADPDYQKCLDLIESFNSAQSELPDSDPLSKLTSRSLGGD